MTNKLVVVVNRLKHQKLRKFYHMKWNFLYQIQLPPEPLTRGLTPPDPRSLCPLSSTEFVEPPPPLRTKFLGTPLVGLKLIPYKTVNHTQFRKIRLQRLLRERSWWSAVVEWGSASSEGTGCLVEWLDKDSESGGRLRPDLLYLL